MDKRAEIINFLVSQQGKFNAATDENVANAEIAALANAYPEAMAQEKGITDVIDRAYEAMNMALGKQSVTETAGVSAEVKAALPMSKDVQKSIYQTLSAQADRKKVSGNSTIELLLYQRPAPAEYIVGEEAPINKASFEKILQNIKEGKYTVCPDDPSTMEDKAIASTTNFNMIKAAYEAGKPLAIHKGDISKATKGYVFTKGTATDQGARTTMTKEKFLEWLTLNTEGYILAGDKKAGVKLKLVQPKVTDKNTGMQKRVYKTVLADQNKKEAAYDIIMRIDDDSPVNANASLRSELRFRVQLPPAQGEAEGKKKVIRVTLTGTTKALAIKPAYSEEFKPAEKNSNFMLPPEGDEYAKIREAIAYKLADLNSEHSNPEAMAIAEGNEETKKYFDEVTNKLSAFNFNAGSSAPAGATL